MCQLRQNLFQEDGIKKYVDELIDKLNDESKLVLFGAGTGGERFWNWAKDNLKNGTENIINFVDNNPLKHGKSFPDTKGVLIKNVNDLISTYDDEMIVVTCGEGDVIETQLISLGINKDRIIIPDIAMINTEGGEFSFIWNHINELQAVYSMLSDDKSRKVFCNVLNYKITHDMNLISEIYDDCENQYFDLELISYDSTDVFLDCGGYVGDSVESYLLHNDGKYEKIITVEADRANYEIEKEKFKNNSKITVIEAACWNKNGTLQFENVGSGSGNVSETGSVSVCAKTIDEIMLGNKVSFIKMDIEGAEYEALLGAYETIRKWHPILQISIYHKQDDFIRLPLLMKSINPDYKLYFRHYRSKSVQETVCYAIPK